MNWTRAAGIILVGGGLLAATLWYTRSHNAASPAPAATAHHGAATNKAAGPLGSAPRLNPLTNRIPGRPGVFNGPVNGARPPGATNLARFPGGTNALRPGQAGPGHTNAVAGTQPPGGSTGSGMLDTLRNLPSNRAFYPALGAVFLLGLAGLLLFRSQAQKAKPDKMVPAVTVSKLAAKPLKKPAVIHACNVLEVGAQARQVWHFDARGGRYVLNRQHTCLDGERLPGSLIGKDWRTLFQRRLNIAWLPPEQVFLRVAQFPRSDFAETLAMVELQLEKLSPMPVAQVVWSIHTLTHAEGNLQTVIVMIVARSVVEEFLGKLESQGYLADRLELPLLDQLQTTAITEDGAWIYPEAAGGKNTALVAWWYGGILQNLDFLTLPPAGPERAPAIKEQLTQMAWAGEMEGWMAAPPEWHLVADVAASEWEPALRAGLEQPVEVVTPLPMSEMAALTARRAAQADPRAGLMPIEFATRYQQQFFDRLWMRGLFAMVGIYALGVAVYMVVLGVADYRTSAVEDQVETMGQAYTNAIRLRDLYLVLKERQDLKFASLNCYNSTARYLPGDATLDTLSFNEGKRLDLAGTAPANYFKEMNEFEGAMRHAPGMEGELLFDPTKGDSLGWRVSGGIANWTLRLELKRSEQ